jgi:CheY-like chemotaxis protein
MILVVDHDPDALEEARKILNSDRRVFLASTAAQALDLVERLGFSVVLVDLDLPGDGYTLIQKLHDHNPDLLIIAVKGAVKASVQRATKNLGIVEYLEKPITPA